MIPIPATAGGLGSAALAYLTDAFNASQLGRRKPARRSAGAGADSLYGGYEKRVADIGAGRNAQQIDLVENLPDERFNPLDPTDNNDLNRFASNSMNRATGNPVIDINPNADEVYLAHELGHVASTHTDVGQMVRQLRDNPKLAAALTGGLIIAPGAAAALNPGDDDLGTSIALAAAAGLPTLVDEGLATRNGLAIMDQAGRRASLGQRGRLAGGALSYLTPALIAGTAGNFVGNLLDENTGEVPM